MEADRNANADRMLLAVKNIVDAWARHTGQRKQEAYKKEFGWTGGDE